MSTHTAPAPPLVAPAGPPLRLSLTPDHGSRSALDGAWWPYSRDLLDQLPYLIAELDGIWGRITRASVHETAWTELRHSLPAGTHDVRVNWFDPAHDPHTITVHSYRIGEWRLLVVPPESAPRLAKQLMTAAARPGNQQTARALVTDGPARPLAPAPREHNHIHIHIRTRHVPTAAADD